MSAYSPLPWTVSTEPAESQDRGTVWIKDVEQNDIAAKLVACRAYGDTAAEAEANAALIVMAVNRLVLQCVCGVKLGSAEACRLHFADHPEWKLADWPA